MAGLRSPHVHVHVCVCILPIALERLSPPLTLPSAPTIPPALCIRDSSASSVGLWSSDMSTALPDWERRGGRRGTEGGTEGGGG